MISSLGSRALYLIVKHFFHKMNSLPCWHNAKTSFKNIYTIHIHILYTVYESVIVQHKNLVKG